MGEVAVEQHEFDRGSMQRRVERRSTNGTRDRQGSSVIGMRSIKRVGMRAMAERQEVTIGAPGRARRGGRARVKVAGVPDQSKWMSDS